MQQIAIQFNTIKNAAIFILYVTEFDIKNCYFCSAIVTFYNVKMALSAYKLIKYQVLGM